MIASGASGPYPKFGLAPSNLSGVQLQGSLPLFVWDAGKARWEPIGAGLVGGWDGSSSDSILSPRRSSVPGKTVSVRLNSSIKGDKSSSRRVKRSSC